MSRFEEATNEPYDIMNKLIEEYFPNLNGAKITIIFDTKKRKSGKKYVLGRFSSTNDLTKFLSATNLNPDGTDYIMYLDKNVWEKIDAVDKRRLVFHELNHSDVDIDKKQPYGIQDHEIQMFESEIDFNADDPRWTMKLATIAESVYDNE